MKGLVAQWTRAHGYEPWCRGFESLLARISQFITKTKEKEQPFSIIKGIRLLNIIYHRHG